MRIPGRYFVAAAVACLALSGAPGWAKTRGECLQEYQIYKVGLDGLHVTRRQFVLRCLSGVPASQPWGPSELRNFGGG